MRAGTGCSLNVVSILRGYPPVAAGVGYFFAEFAGLEWDLRFAFDHLFVGRPELSQAFFRPRESTSSRIEAMFRFTQALAPESPIAQCFADIGDEVRDIVQFRNTLAHGRFGYFPDERGLFVTMGKRQHKLTTEFMAAQLGRMEVVKAKLDCAWHAQRILDETDAT